MRPFFVITLSLACALAGCRDGLDFPVPPPPDFAFNNPEAGSFDSAPGVDQATPDLAAADLSSADLSVTLPPGPAQLLLTAVWPAQTGDADVLELRAVTAGTTQNIVLQQDLSTAHKLTLSTLPNLQVSAGDTILVHLHAAATVTDETGMSQQTCTDPSCRDNAWDLVGTGTAAADIGYSSRVLAVIAVDGSILDGAAFSKSTASQTSNYAGEVELLADTMAQWSACTPSPCTATTAQAVSVNWSGLTNTTDLTGKSVQRVAAVDTNSAADWTVEPSPIPTPSPTPTPTPTPSPSPSPSPGD